MKYRTIKRTPEGRKTRAEVREAVRGVHLIPLEKDGWEVRTLGMRPIAKVFREKEDAVDFAKSIGRRKGSSILIHGRRQPTTETALRFADRPRL